MSDIPAKLRSSVAAAALVMLVAAGPSHAQPAEAQPEAGQPAASQGPKWTLDDCVRVALQHNPTVAIAAASVESSRASREGARSVLYPQATLDASTGLGPSTSSTGTGGGTTGATNSTQVGTVALGVDWSLWQTGRHATLAQSREDLDAATLDQLATLQSLVQQVIVDYYAVLASRELIGVAQDGVAAAQEHVHDVETRIRLGKTAEVDIYAVKSDLATAQLDLIDATSGERTAVAQLRNVLGLDHTTEFDIATTPLDTETAGPPFDQALALARANRPDLASSQAAIRSRGYALDVAHDVRGPNVTVGSQFTYDPSRSRRNAARWSLSARLSWPLFDGHATAADEDRARASLKQAQASARQLDLQIALDVEQTLIELERTTERIKASTEALAAADARLRAARTRYTQVGGALLELTDARAAYTSAAADLVRARFDRQVALVGVRQATGTLPVPTVPSEPEGAGDGSY